MSALCKIEQRDGRGTITLARPDIHNALNGQLIDELHQAIETFAADPQVRFIVLAGEGRSFCAGADLNWMKSQATADAQQSKAEVMRLVRLLDAMVAAPKPVIARVHGAALGGGMGLVAACDLVAAAPRAQFGLTEVRLGIVPAMIFPYLMRRCVRHKLLEAALTGERFRADSALELGLVNAIDEDVDRLIDSWSESLMACGPRALGLVKQLYAEVPRVDAETARELTASMIADARRSSEGQEGMRAFLERRKPAWHPERAESND
ncbi:MAG: enoyl-CoA hydratase/isomerase family protein [Deltaproteobacteria bacterium]|nr:enoyl-CoA hydratase/isomerase family protein [Deltaproteobacteria bacterium]